MGKTPNVEQRPDDGISITVVVIFVAAIGVSALVLNLWGNHLVARAMIGIAWGGYCLFAFGPDFLRFVIDTQRKDKLP